MKMPGYIKLRGPISVNGDEAVYELELRTWHPSFWALVARELWKEFRRARIELSALGRTFVIQRGE